MKGTIFNNMIEQAMLEMHTGFCGKVISISGNLATIQPLSMVKAPGGQPQKQAVIPNCPVIQGARRFVKTTRSTSTGGEPSHKHTVEVWDVVGPAPGDTVFCVCADRDISETRTGSFATPVAGHHSLAGAVVVGIL